MSFYLHLFLAILQLCLYVTVKNKIYTISLLLSFLIILIHDAIPHHHESTSLDKMFCWNAIVENADYSNKFYDSPFGDESEKPLSQEEQNCDKNFPPHHHIAVTNDFSYVRSENVDLDAQNQFVLSFLCTIELFSCNFTRHSLLELSRLVTSDLFASSQFVPGTISLRGPPVLS